MALQSLCDHSKLLRNRSEITGNYCAIAAKALKICCERAAKSLVNHFATAEQPLRSLFTTHCLLLTAPLSTLTLHKTIQILFQHRGIEPVEVQALAQRVSEKMPLLFAKQGDDGGDNEDGNGSTSIGVAAMSQLVHACACMYTMTPDEHFLLDFLPAAGGAVEKSVVLASPCSGHGFKFAPVMGEIIADLVMSGETKHDIAMFRMDNRL
jgi:hypothetical protein